MNALAMQTAFIVPLLLPVAGGGALLLFAVWAGVTGERG